MFHKHYDLFSLPVFVSVIDGQEIKSFPHCNKISNSGSVRKSYISNALIKTVFPTLQGRNISFMSSKVVFSWH